MPGSERLAAGPSGGLVICARRAVTPAGIVPAAVRVEGGRITAVTSPAATRRADRAALVELADDEVLVPGLVDTHVHVNEPGRTHWEGFATATTAAAAGGVTTIVDMPLNSIPPVTNVAALRLKRAAAAGRCAADVGFWGGAVPGNTGELRALHRAGVLGFKCFLTDSGVPEFPPLGPGELMAAAREVAELGSVLIVHAEDAAILGAAPPPAGRAYAGFLRSRPPEAEVAAVATVVNVARVTGARMHILHLSSAAAVPPLAAALADGVLVTAETCPHYLALTAEGVSPGQTQYKCCPPIRDGENRDRLWAALGAGLITSVVSDHSPCPPELKAADSGDFAAAWGGISSVQLGLPVVWTAARERGFGLADVVRWMAFAPASIAGLTRKGVIAQGYDADLAAFAPDERFTVSPGQLLTRHRLTPYAGRELAGVVRRTWLRGIEITAGRFPGQLLARPASAAPPDAAPPDAGPPDAAPPNNLPRDSVIRY